jgi:butyrate kinase
MPDIVRKSIFHSLNHNMSQSGRKRLGKPYDQCRLVVAHLGGGISVGSHLEGRVVDVNNALDGKAVHLRTSGDCRRGSGPPRAVGDLTYEHLRKRITLRRVVRLYRQQDVKELANEHSRGPKGRILDRSKVLRIAKEIASHFAVLKKGEHGAYRRMAHNARMMDMITRRVGSWPRDHHPGGGDALPRRERVGGTGCLRRS